MNNQTTVQQKLTKWQQALVEAVKDPHELWQLLALDPSLLPDAIKSANLFDLRAPRDFIAKMKKSDINDPLLKQVLPVRDERQEAVAFTTDPLNEKTANQTPGLLHKYKNRVLLTVVGGCAINCRYCFRRHFNYTENNTGQLGREKILEYINTDTSINEVIFSGGDPLLANDDYLALYAKQIRAIPHIKRIRVHTRMPVVIPSRITDSLIKWLANPATQNILVLHCNHPNEIDHQLKSAVGLLKQNNITVLNQSVLLKGVNDDAQTLIDLSEKLFETGIMPYYLHLLDKVKGTAHFDLTDKKAAIIYEDMLAGLPGFLVPKLVREVAGRKNKVLQI